MKNQEVQPRKNLPRLSSHGPKGDAFLDSPINISCRLTLELIIKDRDIILVNVGRHEGVY